MIHGFISIINIDYYRSAVFSFWPCAVTKVKPGFKIKIVIFGIYQKVDYVTKRRTALIVDRGYDKPYKTDLFRF